MFIGIRIELIIYYAIFYHYNPFSFKRIELYIQILK